MCAVLEESIAEFEWVLELGGALLVEDQPAHAGIQVGGGDGQLASIRRRAQRQSGRGRLTSLFSFFFQPAMGLIASSCSRQNPR